MKWKPPSLVPIIMVPIWTLSDKWLSRYELLKNFKIVWLERGRQGGDYNSSPCFSYRQAKKQHSTFFKCPRFWPSAPTWGMYMVLEIMAWKKTLHDSHGPNINAFSWVVAEIYLTIHLRKLNVKLWRNSHEHDGRTERRNYIPLSIWLRMWRV